MLRGGCVRRKHSIGRRSLSEVNTPARLSGQTPWQEIHPTDTDCGQRRVYLRLYSGTLRLRDTVALAGREKLKITEMRIPSKGEIVRTDTAYPGEIVILCMAVDRKQQMKEITERLEQGVKDIFTSEMYTTYLRTMAKFHNYSFNNTLLIAMQRPDATLVAGLQNGSGLG